MKIVTKFDGLKPFYFWKNVDGPFTQWRVSEDQFYAEYEDVGKIFFNCAEQHMMWQKANLYDPDMCDEILGAKTPRFQKDLGRKIKNFNQEHWDRTKIAWVTYTNLLKFEQNPEWKKLLVDKVKDGFYFVEASPFDKIWGIGISPEEARAGKAWNGENLLGIALTNVAMHFIKEDQLLYQEDVNYAAVPALDALQEYLKSKGIDVELPINVDLIENQLHEIINKFIEDHYGIGEFRHHH